MSTALAIARAQATAGDPRRPQEISPYKKPPEGEKLPNVRLLFALLCGMGAMALHIPYLNWASLLLICSAVANADSAFEWTQLMQTVVFNIIGLSSSYILPYWQQKSAQGAAAAAQAAAAQAGPLT